MSSPNRKLVVTNNAALVRKYGDAGLAQINAAIDDLIARDAQRNPAIETIVIPVDDPEKMAEHGVPPVEQPGSERRHKAAIDALYRALEEPGYVLLLGAADVIPQQSLVNPVGAASDPDFLVASDLPYACAHGYSTDVRDFLQISRVVGRLPDVVSEAPGQDPEYLVALLTTAARHEVRPRSAYDKYLAVSASVWQASSNLSVRNIFGNASDLRLSPPDGPDWTTAEQRRLAHFINCHGADGMDEFYGEQNGNFPVSHKAATLADLRDGAVIAAECCYGAQLYDPVTAGSPLSICNACLRQGAYGLLGSSTISYGPKAGNADADLICQFFLKHVLSGKSLGEATLLARLEFLSDAQRSGGLLDPFELKTVAQFSLMGDPSVHAVETGPSGHTVVNLSTPSEIITVPKDVSAALRGMRRGVVGSHGKVVGKAARAVLPERKPLRRKSVKTALQEALTQAGLQDLEEAAFSSFDVEAPKTGPKALLAAAGPAAVHVALSKLPVAEELPFDRYVAVVAREIEDTLDLLTLFSR